MANKQSTKTKLPYPQYEENVVLKSDVTVAFHRKSTPYNMGALTRFYQLLQRTKNTRERGQLEDWLMLQIDTSQKLLDDLKAKAESVAKELSAGNIQFLQYPSTTKVTVVCTHPGSYSYCDLLRKFDDVSMIADALWMRRYFDRKQREQTAREAQTVISTLSQSIYQFTNKANGRSKTDLATANKKTTANLNEKESDSAIPVKKKEVIRKLKNSKTTSSASVAPKVDTSIAATA